MTPQIELSYLVEHCTQLPTYKDTLPLITLIQEWGAVHGAVAQAMEAINQIRDHFRQLMPKAPESEPKSLPMIDTPELPELKFFYQVSTQQFSDFKEALRNCLSKIDMYGKKDHDPYKMLWTWESRGYIQQDPLTGVYRKTELYLAKHAKTA